MLKITQNAIWPWKNTSTYTTEGRVLPGGSIQCCRWKRADIMLKSTCDTPALGFIEFPNANTNFKRKFSYWSKACCKIQLESSVTRSLFQFSRREQELLYFDLVLETRTRISFIQSHASRRERWFPFSISGLETRTRNSIFNLRPRDDSENRDFDNSPENFWEMNIFLGISMTNNVRSRSWVRFPE